MSQDSTPNEFTVGGYNSPEAIKQQTALAQRIAQQRAEADTDWLDHAKATRAAASGPRKLG